jgi:cysteine desulfurase
MSVYLDTNATAPMRQVAITAMQEAMASVGNPSSVHGPGRAAKSRMDRARSQVARALRCSANDLVFTSGGTESNNLVLWNAAHTWNCRQILVGATEHPSVLTPAEQSGLPVNQLPVLASGLLDMAALDHILETQQAPFLVALMLANNETGVIQPMAEIAERVHAAGGILHVDAAQAFGKISVNFGALGADSMSVVAHKMGGPGGIGALVVNCELLVSAQMLGGGQETGRRAGTSNVAAMVGFAAAAEEAMAELDAFAELAQKRDALEDMMREFAPDLQVFSAHAPRLPNTLCVATPGFAAETQVMAMDLDGFAISSGSACSSGTVKASHVLRAMQVPEDLALCAIRISLGRDTTDEELQKFAQKWGAALGRVQREMVA